MSGERLRVALLLYAVLAVLNWAFVEGTLRLAVWIFLGALGIKSWIAFEKQRQDS